MISDNRNLGYYVVAHLRNLGKEGESEDASYTSEAGRGDAKPPRPRRVDAVVIGCDRVPIIARQLVNCSHRGYSSI